MTSRTLGKWPGQSVATCSSVNEHSPSCSRAAARPGVDCSSAARVGRSPPWIARTSSSASGSLHWMSMPSHFLWPHTRPERGGMAMSEPGELSAERVAELERQLGDAMAQVAKVQAELDRAKAGDANGVPYGGQSGHGEPATPTSVERLVEPPRQVPLSFRLVVAVRAELLGALHDHDGAGDPTRGLDLPAVVAAGRLRPGRPGGWRAAGPPLRPPRRGAAVGQGRDSHQRRRDLARQLLLRHDVPERAAAPGHGLGRHDALVQRTGHQEHDQLPRRRHRRHGDAARAARTPTASSSPTRGSRTARTASARSRSRCSRTPTASTSTTD